MVVSAEKKMEVINQELQRVAAGWHVRAINYGHLKYELVDPSGIAQYCRNSLDVIAILAFGHDKGSALLEHILEDID